MRRIPNLKPLFLSLVMVSQSLVVHSQLLAGPFAYVTNAYDFTVSVIDVENHGVVASIDVPMPLAIGIAPDGRRAYVASETRNIVVLDLRTHSVLDRISVSGATNVAVSRSGRRLFVTSTREGMLTILDLRTNDVTGSLQTGELPIDAIEGPRQRVYVSNVGSNTVSVVDGDSRSVVDTVSFPGGPKGLAVNSTLTELYVAGGQSDLWVVDLLSHDLLATVKVGELPARVAVTPDGNLAFVTNEFGPSISVIDTRTRMAVGQPIAAERNPFAIAASPDGRWIYATSPTNSIVWVIDPATRRIETTIPVDNGPVDIAFVPTQVAAAPVDSWYTLTILVVVMLAVGSRVVHGRQSGAIQQE